MHVVGPGNRTINVKIVLDIISANYMKVQPPHEQIFIGLCNIKSSFC